MVKTPWLVHPRTWDTIPVRTRDRNDRSTRSDGCSVRRDYDSLQLSPNTMTYPSGRGYPVTAISKESEFNDLIRCVR
jgi:hypothetical protein